MSRSHRPVFGVIAALWLMVLASSSQVMVVAPILPRIATALDAPQSLMGTLITGYASALSVFALVIGPISDRIGRRKILLLGTGTMTVALGLHGLAQDFTTLLLCRIFAGAAGGLLTGSAISYVGDYFPYERRGWAAGWVMSGFAVGQILGVPAGAIAADHYGFRAPFLLFMGVMAVAFLLTAFRVPQPPIERDGSEEALGFGSALRGYLELLAQPAIRGAAFAYATMFFAVSNFVVYFPTWVETQRGLLPVHTASLFTVGGIASVLFGPRAGHLSDRFGRKPLIIVSCLGTALLFAGTTFGVRGLVTAYLAFFLAMTLLALRLSPFQALLTALAPAHRRGSLMSLVVAIGQVGGGLGGAVAGLVYADAGYLGCTLLAAAAIGLTGLIVAIKIPEPQRRAASTPAT